MLSRTGFVQDTFPIARKVVEVPFGMMCIESICYISLWFSLLSTLLQIKLYSICRRKEKKNINDVSNVSRIYGYSLHLKYFSYLVSLFFFSKVNYPRRSINNNLNDELIFNSPSQIVHERILYWMVRFIMFFSSTLNDLLQLATATSFKGCSVTFLESVSLPLTLTFLRYANVRCDSKQVTPPCFTTWITKVGYFCWCLWNLCFPKKALI